VLGAVRWATPRGFSLRLHRSPAYRKIMDQKRLEELYAKGTAETMDSVQDGVVKAINRRLAIGNPVYFGLLPYYTDAPTWKKFTGEKLSLQEEFGMKEVFIGLPVYSTFVVVDRAEKDEMGKPKVCILDSIPESVHADSEFLEYHRNCMNKLMKNWRDNVRERN
jgi:hypothetical protein